VAESDTPDVPAAAVPQARPAAPAAPKAQPAAPAAAAKPAFREPVAHAAPADALAAMARRGSAAPAKPAGGVPVAKALDGDSAAAAATPGRAGQTPHEEKADPLVGTNINGFKILARIGSGGFGVVYRAFDTNLERSVAIKMLPPKLAKAGQGLVERFLREARSAAKLSHPNIVTIHQICPYKDTYYIVMELVDGGALHEYLAARKRFDPIEATRIMRAAAEGLGHAHRRGIIHRDVKPGNIMLTNDGQAKVSDFGLARDVLQGHDIVGPGHSLGTPRYMAPEMALGEEPTAASDLYSLAATYYALLTGRPPFDASNDREVMKKHVTELVPDPRQFVPSLPVAVYRFFEKAMAKEPSERYQTAEEFVEALDRLDFTPNAEGGATAAVALAVQVGRMAAEDRGSHLSEALNRAVSRTQRQRTPLTETAPLAQKAKSGKSWLVWVLVGAGVLLLLGGAAVLAIYLSQQEKPLIPTPPVVAPKPAEPGAKAPEPGAKAPDSGQAAKPPETPAGAPPVAPAEKPPETPAGTPPAKATEPATATKTAPPQPMGGLEEAARAALGAAKEFEADSKIERNDVITTYEDTVINVYPKTKAADEARAAVERIKKVMENPPPKKENPPPKK
jgi:hypothetical protein